jgi:glycosyltransferase involved in cell wall biosynthesis
MHRPSVSVLLPYRDAEGTLGECIASIEAQTLRDHEVLAVDDHSRDGGPERVAAWAARDARIRPLTHPGHGLVDALNFGLEAARSEWVARMDADDRMHPRRLAEQAAHLARHPGLAVLGCRVRLFPAQAVRAGYREYVAWQNRQIAPADIAEEVYVESPLAHPSVMLRRRRILDLGGYRHGPFPEDYELWLRLVHAGEPMAKLPRVLLDWREGEARLSRTDPRCARAALDRLRADYLARDVRLARVRTGSRGLVVWGAGRRTRRRAGLLLERGYSPTAWVDIDPRKIGNRVEGVPVVPPQWLDRQPRPYVLVYVTNHGARELIAARLATLGYRRGRDYLMVG